MSPFRTSLPTPSYPFDIGHQTPLLAIGSCFAQHMGQRLQDLQFNLQLNPLGILYNPVSIAKAIHHLLTPSTFEESELFLHQGLWHSWDHHGQFSHSNPQQSLHHINARLQEAHAQLGQGQVLLLTLGTAQAFELRQSGQVVANCHKLPAPHFRRYRLTVNQIVSVLAKAFKSLAQQCPKLQVVLTVSPIRHIRDGLIESQRSKASLILAAGELCEQFDYLHYFPAYEWMLDDLRDYRFYANDMIHPSETAIDYIWQHFQEAFWSPQSRELAQKIRKVELASRHRPLHPDSQAHRQFIQKSLDNIKQLEEKYSFLDFSEARQRLLSS
ncbi:MAG: GSCFA domain-containing protein [Bacteroidota bacterium]